ncbi:MAG: tyrosine-type recombinase/integrase [Chloroflexota bacterium]
MDVYEARYPNWGAGLLLKALEMEGDEKWAEARGWGQALVGWLEAQKREGTRRAYFRAVDDFLIFAGRLPGEARAEDVAAWAAHLREQGYKASSVRYQVGVVGSFYDWVIERLGLAAESQPVQAGMRGEAQVYQARPLTEAETAALLGAIDRETRWGRRDYALALTCLRTGRWVNEVTALRWGELREAEDGVWYTWQPRRRKGEEGGPARCEARLDGEAWQATRDYLRETGRLAGMQAEDYIFAPLTDAGGRLAKRYGADWQKRPLGINTVEKALRAYARSAGLNEEAASPTTLRYTAAMRRLEAGDDEQALMTFLGHSCLEVTRKFVRELTAGEAQRRVQRRQLEAKEARPGGESQRPPARRRVGAQPGNRNAEKHGLYTKDFEMTEADRLAASLVEGLNEEIAVMRVATRRAFERAEAMEDGMPALRGLAMVGDMCVRIGRMIKLRDELMGVQREAKVDPRLENFMLMLREGREESEEDEEDVMDDGWWKAGSGC